MERIKVKSISCNYKVFKENGVVIATAEFEFLHKKFTCVGKAHTNEWYFVEETGKKLARARAEKQAYVKARGIARGLRKVSNSITNALDNTINHLDKCIEHQNEYIKDF